mmetsp:Transcript_15745/g.35097  ORF Transcript_15745/g.35097 Transcript_15745/m.35097 type:complete len:94 (+) Transcript_15745:193-474(+)
MATADSIDRYSLDTADFVDLHFPDMADSIDCHYPDTTDNDCMSALCAETLAAGPRWPAFMATTAANAAAGSPDRSIADGLWASCSRHGAAPSA